MRKRKKPSEFQLYLRGGVYYARVYQPETHRYSSAKSTKETNVKAASVVAHQMVVNGQFKPRSADPILSDFLEEYWENPRRKLSKMYRDNSLRFVKVAARCPALKGVRLSHVSSKLLNRYKDFLETSEGYTPRMINQGLIAVTIPLRWAFSRGFIPANPGLGVERAKENQKERGILSLKEIEDLLALEMPLREKAILALSMLAGLRRGEVRGLLWEDVDFETRVVRVRHNRVSDAEGLKAPKARSEGVVPLLEPLADLLEALRSEAPYGEPTDFVIYHADRGKPVGLDTIRRVFDQSLLKIGITGQAREDRHLVFHSLRHSFASFARKELPDFIAARLTRHKEIRTLDRYSHTMESDFEEAKEKLNKRIG